MVHLDVRSAFSLLNGLMSVDTIVAQARKAGMSAVALTDFHVLHGALDFQKACQKANIKPLFGMQVTIEAEGERFESVLLARNNMGYQGLMKLSYKLSTQAYVLFEDIQTYQNDLIFLAYSEHGYFEGALLKGDLEVVAERVTYLKNNFKHVYIGISHMESSFFHDNNKRLSDIAGLQGVESVALSKVYYENKADEEAFRVVQAIGKGTYLDDKTLVSAPNRYFYDQETIAKYYSAEQIALTQTIADACHVDVFAIKTNLPQFPSGQSVDNTMYLRELSHFGLKRRVKDKLNQDYIERLRYELDVITNMGFTDYFLIVYDVIRFAKKNGVYVGPGRGSSAGSLVAYSLGITEVDPLVYGLLFERFLNPERISMPDIDIDFPDDKRQLVIDYVRDKYGDSHVAHIVTYGTLKARQAFRDVCRVLQVPVRKVDTGAKLISVTALQENYDNVPKFRTYIHSEKVLERAFSLALKVEGLMRHTSMHAAGVVLSSLPLEDVVPIQQLDDTYRITQYDMTYLEAIGLIKIDFLGLRNLTIIDNISRQIQAKHPFNIMEIPLDDEKTYKLISEAETVGVFQLESDGMKALLRKMKPYQFNDIVDTIALYRPGPMENIPAYLEGRQHPESVQYLHPMLKAITASTYGILVYQEQIMQVAQIMAGFSLGKADILRKAMGKKDAQELHRLQEAFLEGCQKQGHDMTLAQDLFALIEKFANYGFNKSHSVAYGLIAYQMAYLKANYAHMFYTYLLTSVLGSDVKTRQYVDECRRRHVLLLSPNLERSGDVYHLEGAKIRLPFTLIKGISKTVAASIIEERHNHGTYRSFYDAVSRLNLVGIKSNQFEALIKGGAFDYFGYPRLGMLASLEEAIRYANIIKVVKGDQKSLNHGLISEPIFTHVDENERETLNMERDVLGFYYTEHPAVALKLKHGTDAVVNCEPRVKPYRVIAMIDTVKQHRAKNGKMMAFLSVSDDTGLMDAVVFPNVYERVRDILMLGNIVLIKGSVRDQGSFIVQEILKFENQS